MRFDSLLCFDCFHFRVQTFSRRSSQISSSCSVLIAPSSWCSCKCCLRSSCHVRVVFCELSSLFPIVLLCLHVVGVVSLFCFFCCLHNHLFFNFRILFWLWCYHVPIVSFSSSFCFHCFRIEFRLVSCHVSVIVLLFRCTCRIAFHHVFNISHHFHIRVMFRSYFRRIAGLLCSHDFQLCLIMFPVCYCFPIVNILFCVFVTMMWSFRFLAFSLKVHVRSCYDADCVPVGFTLFSM